MKKSHLLTSLMTFVLALSLGACNSETQTETGEENVDDTTQVTTDNDESLNEDDVLYGVLAAASSISLDSILSSWSALHASVKEGERIDDAYLSYKGSNLYGYWETTNGDENIVTTKYILDGIEYAYTLNNETGEEAYSSQSELYTYITILEYHNRLDFTKPYYFARNLLNNISSLDTIEYTLDKSDSTYSVSVLSETETYTYITDTEYTLTGFGCRSNDGSTSYFLNSISKDEIETKMSSFDMTHFSE